MRNWMAVPIVLFSASAFAAPTSGKFIPWSPLTEEEIASQKARFPRGMNSPTMDTVLRNPQMTHRYRERDIVAAYPELRGSKKLSSCSNSIMQGAARMVFVSRIEDHEVTLKTLSCSGADRGVRCGSVETTKAYFLKSPREPIELDGVSQESAQLIAETYEAKRVDQLPDWFEGHFPTLTAIKSLTDNRFTLFFGDFYCAGCSFKYDARLDTAGDQSRLVVIGNADGSCY